MTDAKLRTCRECRYDRLVKPAPEWDGFHMCVAPSPAWARRADNQIRDCDVYFASDCPCYSPKEPTP